MKRQGNAKKLRKLRPTGKIDFSKIMAPSEIKSAVQLEALLRKAIEKTAKKDTYDQEQAEKKKATRKNKRKAQKAKRKNNR